jgi:hypothetical protein
MLKRIFYSEYEKDKFVRELKLKGLSVRSIEKDFVGVFTVYYS